MVQTCIHTATLAVMYNHSKSPSLSLPSSPITPVYWQGFIHIRPLAVNLNHYRRQSLVIGIAQDAPTSISPAALTAVNVGLRSLPMLVLMPNPYHFNATWSSLAGIFMSYFWA